MQGRLTASSKLDFFPFHNWEHEFPAARRIGFDAIEWGFATEGWEKNPILAKNGIEKIEYLIGKNYIAIPSICGYYFINHGFVGEKAKNNIKILNQLIQAGAQIGAKRILIPFLGKSEIKNENEKNGIK